MQTKGDGPAALRRGSIACGRRRMSGGPDDVRALLRPEGEPAAFDSVSVESTGSAVLVDGKKAMLPSQLSSSLSAEAAGVAVAGSAAARPSQEDEGAIDESREAKLPEPEAVHRRQSDQEDTVDDNKSAAAGHCHADIALPAADDAQVATGPTRMVSCDATQNVKRRRSMRERNVSRYGRDRSCCTVR
jgi:hypothetical protein